MSDRQFVVGVILATLAVTSLPYAFGYLVAPPDRQFMGIMLDVPDHAQYFSWMRELTYGFLAANKLTPEPNEPAFFNLLWWGMGRLAELLHLDYAQTFQVLRLLASAVFLLLCWRACGWVLEDRLQRRTAFLVSILASGFGWILVTLKYTLTRGELLFPLDVFIAEPNTFLCVLAYPHFCAAGLYLLVFDLLRRGTRSGRYGYAVAAGVVALFVAAQHTYDLATIYGVMGAWGLLLLLRDRRPSVYLIVSGLIVVALSIWPGIYAVALTRIDPIWEEVLKQFDNAGVFTPGPLHLPILLGPAFLLAIVDLLAKEPLRLAGRSDAELLLRAWFAATVVLIYLPVDWRVHLLNGWQVPIAIFATRAWFGVVLPWIRGRTDPGAVRGPKGRPTIWAAAVLVALVAPTNFYLWTWRFVDLARADYPYFLHRDEIAALSWLEANAGGDDVVLSGLEVGQYVPMLTGSHAFVGHWAQTVAYHDKLAIVREYFDVATTDARREEIATEYGVDYVLHGPAERALGLFSPGQSAIHRAVFATPQVQIYALGATTE